MMTYKELLSKDAASTEIRDFLVSGDSVPLTMRIPRTLRDSLKEAAELEGMSLTSFVKQCMLEKLSINHINQ